MKSLTECRYDEFVNQLTDKTKTVFTFDAVAIERLNREFGRVILKTYEDRFWQVLTDRYCQHLVFELCPDTPVFRGFFDERECLPLHRIPLRALPTAVIFYNSYDRDSDGKAVLRYNLTKIRLDKWRMLQRYDLTELNVGPLPVVFKDEVWEDRTTPLNRKSTHCMFISSTGDVTFNFPKEEGKPRKITVPRGTVLMLSRYKNEWTGGFSKAAYTLDPRLLEKHKELVRDFFKGWERYNA